MNRIKIKDKSNNLNFFKKGSNAIILTLEENSMKNFMNEFKKFIPYYFKGIPNLKDLKMQIYSADSTNKILELLQQFF